MRYQFGSGCDLSVPLCTAARTGLHAIDPLNLNPELVSAVPPPPTSSGRARRWLVLYPRAIPLVIFLAPAIALGMVHGVPELDGRALDNPVLWTTLRLVLTGLSLILPWILYVWLVGARR